MIFSWRYRWFGLLFAVLVFSVLTVPAFAAEVASEKEIQAAIIIKFIDFIEWPDDSFTDESAPFTLTVLGENDYGGLFESFLGRQVQDRAFAIRYIEDIQEIGRPQILIVSQTQRQRAGDILEQLEGRAILTIGAFPDFAELGGLINFYRKPNNRIGFEINLETKEKSGLKISAYLLKLGKIIPIRIQGDDS
jgi:hypothetical protein